MSNDDINVLGEAEKIIYGDREKTYGNPAANLQTIADFWTAYLGHAVNVDDVCVMMILLKSARLVRSPQHRDSLVDICGYAALMERVQKYRASKNNTPASNLLREQSEEDKGSAPL